MLPVDLGHPAQGCQWVDVEQAGACEGVEVRLRCGAEPREPVREQHDELLAVPAYPLIPGARVGGEDLRQGAQRLPTGTAGAQPGGGLACRLPRVVIRVRPLPCSCAGGSSGASDLSVGTAEPGLAMPGGTVAGGQTGCSARAYAADTECRNGRMAAVGEIPSSTAPTPSSVGSSAERLYRPL